MINTISTFEKRTVQYKDLFPRLLITLIGAHYIVSFGEPESFFELLLMWDYQRSLLYNWAIAFLVVTLIRSITLKLDEKFDWQQNPIVRILLQSVFGICFLSMIAFLLAAVYFAVHDLNILETEYISYDFPMVILMLMLINFYYFVYYVAVTWAKSKNAKHVTTTYKKVIIVQQGAKNIPIIVDDIAYFYRSNEENFLRLKNGTDYLITSALDAMENKLDPHYFFRVNRQFLISFSACERFEPVENDKLELFTNPSFKEPIIVSQKKAPDFRKWIEK